jgi:hypothetical protein
MGGESPFTARAAWLLVVLVVLAFFSVNANAAVTELQRQALTGFAKNSTGTGYTRVPSWTDPSSVRNWSIFGTGSSGGFRAADNVAVSAKGGPLPVVSTASVSLKDGAVAVAMCLIGGGPVACAIGTTAAAAYSAYRIYEQEGDLKQDPGVAPIPVQAWTTCEGGLSPVGGGSMCGFGPTPSAANADMAAKCPSANAGQWVYTCSPVQCGPVVGTSSQCSHTRTETNTFTQYTITNTIQNGASAITQQQCPAVVDALNPANSIPYGAAPGPDGKCPTARYNHPTITPEQAGDKVVANPSGLPNATWRDALRDAIENGGQKAPATVTTTGPASQPGTPTSTTTTGPAGTETKVSTPTYNYNYTQGDTITYNVTYVTITTNAGGTTTETTTAPGAGDQDTRSECEKSPQSSGCAKLDVPDGPQTPEHEVPISAITPQSGWGADNGTCPALVHTASLGDVDVFGLFCTFLTGIRFAVIGCAWLLAGFIFLGRVD